MQRTIAQMHRGLVLIFLAALLVQFYLAGAPIFGVTSYAPHRVLGSAILVAAILLPVLALIGRLGRQQIQLSSVLLVLSIIQAFLPSLRGTVSWIAALHAVNALAIVGVSFRLRRQGRVEVLRAGGE
jgi:uncharacterized membrane protein